MCLIRCAVRPSFLQGEERRSGLVDGDLGDLDPNPGAEADPAACPWESPSAELLPPPRLSQPPGSSGCTLQKNPLPYQRWEESSFSEKGAFLLFNLTVHRRKICLQIAGCWT